MRTGFTLVETIVALVLVQFGLLAVAATSAMVMRDMAVASRVNRARDAARERLELLRVSACAAPVTGSRAVAGIVESWRVTGDGSVKALRDSVEYALPRGRRGQFVLEEKMLCG